MSLLNVIIKKNMKNLLIVALSSFLSIALYGQVSITSVSVTPTTCNISDGTATVNITGGIGPFEYRLNGGSPQSANMFTNLAPGTYTFEVVDTGDSGNSDSQMATIIDGFVALSIDVQANGITCIGDTDGEISTTPTGGSGNFEYTLLQGATVIAGPQASNTFTNLANGLYTVRVRDLTCGSVQNEDVTVDGYFQSYERIGRGVYVSGTILDCSASPRLFDYRVANFGFNNSASAINAIGDNGLTFRLYDGTDNTGTLLTSFDDVNGFDDSFAATGVGVVAPSSGSIFLEIVDSTCGNVLNSFVTNMDQTLSDAYLSLTSIVSCTDDASITLTWKRRRSNVMCDDTTIEVRDGGVVIDSKTETWNYSNAFEPDTTFSGLERNKMYEVCLINCCGEEYCETITTPTALPTPIINHAFQPGSSCADDLAGVRMNISNMLKPISLRLISAPAQSQDGFSNIFDLAYSSGDVVSMITGSQNRFVFSNLGIGNYEFELEDACGNTYPYSFSITNTDPVRTIDITDNVVEVCGNNGNQYEVNVIENTNANYSADLFYEGNSEFSLISVPENDRTFVISNLGSGEVSYEFTLAPISGGSVLVSLYGACPAYTGTNTIEPYVNPDISTKGQQCDPSTDYVIYATPTSGIAPFTYVLYDGTDDTGTVIANQVDNGVFVVPSNGPYFITIEDDCGNQRGVEVTFGDLLSPAISLDATCFDVLESANITLTSTTYTTADLQYEWRDPSNNIVGTSSELVLNDFDPATQDGTYTLRVTVGCKVVEQTVEVNGATLCSILPITLSYFTAEKDGEDALLLWETLSETNNSHFDIEYSFDGLSYNLLHTVEGQGTTTNSNTYQYTHENIGLESTNVFYRLKQVDYDGLSTYSPVRVVTFKKNNDVILYPNPLQRGQQLIIVGKEEFKSLEVYTINGQLVYSNQYTDNENVVFIETSNLASGNYIVVINKEEVNKFIIN